MQITSALNSASHTCHHCWPYLRISPVQHELKVLGTLSSCLIFHAVHVVVTGSSVGCARPPFTACVCASPYIRCGVLCGPLQRPLVAADKQVRGQHSLRTSCCCGGGWLQSCCSCPGLLSDDSASITSIPTTAQRYPQLAATGT